MAGWTTTWGSIVSTTQSFFRRHWQKALLIRERLRFSEEAFHLLLAAGVGPGDEVIVPALTFVASVSAVRYVGADPVMCEVRGVDDLAALATSFNGMARSLQGKLRELEDLSNVQRQFVSDVSHELRTPLSTIKMAADLLFEARAELDAAAGRSVELLASQLDRFESLLVDLLEISRFDAGAATLDVDLVDVCDLVRRSADDAQQLAERRGNRIEFRLPAIGCFAEADRRRVERILRNILVNAVEHGEGKEVVVTTAMDSDAVAVSVRDYGVGLRPGEEQKVFDRFWRADPARARSTGGTGLGLAISLEDARLHGGWLQAWGERGKGSVFRLTLPRVAGQELAGSPLPLGPDEAEPGPELIHPPLPLRVSPAVAGPELGGSGFAGPDYAGPDLAGAEFAGPEFAGPEFASNGFTAGLAGTQPTGSQSAGSQSAGSQRAGSQRAGTDPEGPGGTGAVSG